MEITKEEFQRHWGKSGYTEDFTYGVGIDEVSKHIIAPFISKEKDALEIGCGGGSFTKRLIGNFKTLTAIDVIKKPAQFNDFKDFTFIELSDKDYDCTGVKDGSIDFCFCYNVFCHLPHHALKSYLKSVNRVLKQGGDFVFMLSNIEELKKLYPMSENPDTIKEGDFTSLGHFSQNTNTLKNICDFTQWEVINENIIPNHRDIIIHLRKK